MAKPEAVKPKRKMLTPEERVAKLEADLAAARERAQSKDVKQHATLTEKIAAKETKRNDLDIEIGAMLDERTAIEARLGRDPSKDAVTPEPDTKE